LAPVLLKAGLRVEQIDHHSTRLKVPSQIKFLELAATAFHLARDFDLREIGLLYYVAASEVVADALQKAEGYSRTVNERISLRLRPGHQTTVVFDYVDAELH
jgi:hypothetical protein